MLHTILKVTPLFPKTSPTIATGPPVATLRVPAAWPERQALGNVATGGPVAIVGEVENRGRGLP